jgi:hypothetical protein
MIITAQKKFDDIKGMLGDAKSVYLVGCSLCSTTCKTGGEKELEAMAEDLVKAGYKVSGQKVLDPACNMLDVKRFAREQKNELGESAAVLCFTCGGGTQAVAEIITDIRVMPAADTLFQGEITKVSLNDRQFEQKCSLCGECTLMDTAAICPVTRCPKGLMNGPCGGIKNGKCEVNNEIDCAWLKIYEKMKKTGQTEKLRNIVPPKDHRKGKKPQNLKI